ncbi:MAG: bifunctional adenosylcobinamide kinase/adenosylcobinamide-phosphate guanylyltransferase [Eubacteriales bacterium]|nr:bifunctional adenosylcobinamide kinase/adenosylcobinamide-phosphate guanylyltransferase [Eubacteriales bacterium]
MLFVTGPLYSGKKDYVKLRFGWDDTQLASHAVWDVQELAAQEEALEALADRLSAHEVVIATEVGGGVVPIDPQARRAREAAGRLSCLLAQRADTVIRVFCGLPLLLKGE